MTSSTDVGFWAAMHNAMKYSAACLLPCELAGPYPTATASLLTSVLVCQQLRLGLACIRGPQILQILHVCKPLSILSSLNQIALFYQD